MAKHTLVYYGWFDYSFRHFTAETTRYWTKGRGQEPDNAVDVEFPDADKFKGIHFGFMDIPEKEFVIVKIKDLVLRVPLPLISHRYGVKGPGPSFAHLDDDAATNIIVDAIVANPEFRDVLGRYLRDLCQM